MTRKCLHCDIRLTEREVAEGWCEGCGKRLPLVLAAWRRSADGAAASPPARRHGAAGGFGRLPAYPGRPDQASEAPPPKTALIECLAGAILGAPLAGVGSVLAGCDPATILLGLLLGGVVGALDGLLVAKLFGKTGTTLSVGAVLGAVPRVLLWTFVWPILPPIIMAGFCGRGRHRFAESLDKWNQAAD